MLFQRLRILLSLLLLILTARSLPADQPVRLFPRNTEVPFCYLPGGKRSWPILSGQLPKGAKIELIVSKAGRAFQPGAPLKLGGLTVGILRNGKLTIACDGKSPHPSFELQVKLRLPAEAEQQQRLRIRPAPPARPISYVSDLVDDLIRIFWDARANRFRPLTRDAFDQHFRRLQAHGVSRLVVWQSPFPLMPDKGEFRADDWQLYVAQARAIIENEELSAAMRASAKLQSWTWLRQAMSLRLTTEFGRLFTQSATDHGIKLTASFRPFEHALAKYYEVPAFDQQGNYLWGFSPTASPVVNYHADKVGFAHYREILRRAGKPSSGRLVSLQWEGLGQTPKLVERFRQGKRDIAVIASAYPPLDGQSWVLVRGPQSRFQLKRFQELQVLARQRQRELTGFHLEMGPNNSLKISGLRFAAGEQRPFIRLRAVSEFAKGLPAPADLRFTLRAAAGNRLGRCNIYWALNETADGGPQTRVAGILADGGFRAEFQATENSISQLLKRRQAKLPWADNEVVINLGRAWSTEMVDFQRPASRAYAIAQLRTILAYPAFDEILINTRSHTQLAASMGETSEGVETILRLRQNGHRAGGYRSSGRTYIGLGIDRAYAPRDSAQLPRIRKILDSPNGVERITTWQPAEWQATCQSSASPFVWRFTRNKMVASGVRQLLLDLEAAFPKTRIRVVLPQRGGVDRAMERALSQMRKPDGGVYGMDFFRHIWSTNNFIPTIAEGMCMIDLRGLKVEPVFLGIRFAPDDGPLRLFVERCLEDLKDNHGSSYRGPRSFFYEAQETLRMKDQARFTKRRQEIIKLLLSKRDQINEVLLYESADWMYYLPIDDPHSYLEKDR